MNKSQIEQVLKDAMDMTAKEVTKACLEEYDAAMLPLITKLTWELQSANKAIVALSEALDGLVNESLGHDMPGTVWRPFAETLTTHADTIKRAKESV